MKPKKWIKKYCRNNYVICDGMTENFDFWDMILVPIGLLGIVVASTIALHIYRFKRRNKKGKK